MLITEWILLYDDSFQQVFVENFVGNLVDKCWRDCLNTFAGLLEALYVPASQHVLGQGDGVVLEVGHAHTHLAAELLLGIL